LDEPCPPEGPGQKRRRAARAVGAAEHSEQRRGTARHEKKPDNDANQRKHWFDHPLVDELDLHAEKLTINDTDGLLLCIFHPEPGSRSAELMKVLGNLATPEPVDER
jgi:transcription regulator MmyB-like protein